MKYQAAAAAKKMLTEKCHKQLLPDLGEKQALGDMHFSLDGTMTVI
jgi:hypothetical protein